jgi:hypothetical protein
LRLWPQANCTFSVCRGAPEFTLVFSGVHVTRPLVLCVCFVDRCLSFSPYFCWPLCCLFFDLRILITTLVS